MHRAITVALALAAAVAIGVVVVDVLLRPQAGPLALAAVIEEHLLLVGLVAGLALGLVTVGRGRANAIGRLLAVVVLVLAIVRLGSEWWSSPGTATSESRAIRVLSWNLELGSKAAQSSVAGIASGDADLVALQELTPDVAAAIEADAALKARYPYRILAPDDGVRGMGLLSRLPLTATPDTSPGLGFEGPPILHAGLLMPDGRRIDVLDVHPFPPTITRLAGLPAGLDTRHRDADLAAIRSLVDGLADPSSAVVVGDLNTSPFEAGYGTLVGRGLVDAHEAAGTGPGFTWRPSSLEWLGTGFLRIDHVISGNALHPISTAVDCSIAGDHCRLFALLGVP